MIARFKSAAASEKRKSVSIPGEVRPNTILPERVYLEESDLILHWPELSDHTWQVPEQMQ